jgi:DNA-binding NarL/FixJ family response regulator
MTAVGEPDQATSRVDAGWFSDPPRRGDPFSGNGQARTDQISTDVLAPVVDNNEMVAEKFRRILAIAKNVDVVAIATNAVQALEESLRHEPHVIVMDYRLPDVDRVTATEIRARLRATKILIVIGSDQPEVRDAALDTGSAPNLEETGAFDRLLDTVQSVTQADNNLSRLTSVGGRGRDHVGALTRRQAEILGIMTEGLSDQAIADRLTLSLNTVRTHVQTILRKLGAHSKLEAVAVATRRRLLDR